MTKHKWEYYDDSGRVCTKCKIYKPYSAFHKHSRCPNGHNTVCKSCRKPGSKARYRVYSVAYKLLYSARNRAKLRDREFTITVQDIVVPENCPILGVPLVANTEHAPSLDRIDSSKGYTKDNIRVVSKRANMLKNNATVKEVEAILNDLRSRE